MQDVTWVVLTSKTIPEGEGWVYIGVSTEDYEALSLNVAETLRWVAEARQRLDYYAQEPETDE